MTQPDPPPPARGARWDRRASLLLLATLAILLGSRLLLIRSPEHLLPRQGVEWQQLLAAVDTCGCEPVCAEAGRQRPDGQGLARYLPAEREFHGVLLLNNALLVPLFCGAVRSEQAPRLLALLYACLACACWAVVLRRRFGPRAMVWFCALFVLAPAEQIRVSLYLEGSHADGMALVAVAFLLALGGRWPRRGLFLAAGSLFFLYKGTGLALVLLLPWALASLPGWREGAGALLLLLAGLVPQGLWAWFYGFHGHHLADGSVHSLTPRTWAGLFSGLQVRADGLGTPAATLSLRPVTEFPDRLYDNDPQQFGWYGLFFVGCLLGLAVAAAWRLRAVDLGADRWPMTGWTSPSPPLPALGLVLAYPAVYWLFLATSTLDVHGRYLVPLYPVINAVFALSLALLPPRLAALVGAALLALILPSTAAVWF